LCCSEKSGDVHTETEHRQICQRTDHCSTLGDAFAPSAPAEPAPRFHLAVNIWCDPRGEGFCDRKVVSLTEDDKMSHLHDVAMERGFALGNVFMSNKLAEWVDLAVQSAETDRRRPGRVRHPNPHLVALLRDPVTPGSVNRGPLDPETVNSGMARFDDGLLHPSDDLDTARPILLAAIVSAPIWGGMFWFARWLLGS
jgi:hypothetical protein